MSDTTPKPTHVECYGQPWSPSVENDPAYKPDAERPARKVVDLGEGLTSVTYTD